MYEIEVSNHYLFKILSIHFFHHLRPTGGQFENELLTVNSLHFDEHLRRAQICQISLFCFILFDNNLNNRK